MSDSTAHTVISGPQLNQRFVKVDWRGQVFQDIEFYACHFEDSILREANFAEAYHYTLDLQQNKVKNAVFALPEAVSLLKGFGIKVKL